MRSLLFLFLLLTVSLYGVDSREADPESLIENVSTIYGDYSEGAVDMVVLAPDPLVVSRFYSSRDEKGNFGGWRFFPQVWLALERGPEGKIAIEVGDRDGAHLTYSGKTKLIPDLQGHANNAKGSLLPWTDLTNNSTVYDPQLDQIEIQLCSKGKRFYRKIPGENGYRMTHEILPSGNKLFYTFDDKGRLIEVQETNKREEKILGWIKLGYGEGVWVKGSDGQRVDYFLENGWLTRVAPSNHPETHYRYQDHLLIEKRLPERAVTQIEYDSALKVKKIIDPEGGAHRFFYREGATEILGPEGRKEIHRFDPEGNLTAIEHYLEGELYRLFRKQWEEGRLIKSSLEDESGRLFHCKCYEYEKGKLSKSTEVGNLTGAAEKPLSLNSDGVPIGEELTKIYTYVPNGYIESDPQGCGIKYSFLQDTCLLAESSILWSERKHEYSRRYFYGYNEDAVLVSIAAKNGAGGRSFDERHTLSIVPKKEMPNLGAPETIEWKYHPDLKSFQILQQTAYEYDGFGNVIAGSVCNSDGACGYSFQRGYKDGLLCYAIDPNGSKTSYEYDRGHRLTSAIAEQFHTFYIYDRSGRILSKEERSSDGISRESFFTYDQAGQLLSAIYPEGEERFSYDPLGRQLTATSPEGEFHYRYDLFDHPIGMESPSGQSLKSSYTPHGHPTLLEYPDGTREVFRYNLMGRLDLHRDRKGLYHDFTYDELGRLERISHFDRGRYRKESDHFTNKCFCKKRDLLNSELFINYDNLERIQSISKRGEETELNYDALGRIAAIKRWVSADDFLLERREYDSLGHLIEERIEDHLGKLFLKRRYEYDSDGHLLRLFGYPNNKESLLAEYEYDGWGRLTAIVDCFGFRSEIDHPSWLDRKWTGPKGHQIRELFDSAGRPIHCCCYSPDHQLLYDWSGRYDSSGLLAEESAGGYRRKYERRGSAVVTPEGQFLYDEYGDLIEKKSGDEFVKFEYNRSGLCSALLFSEGGKEERILVHFNSKDRPELVERPSSWRIGYSYIRGGDRVGLEWIEDEWGRYQVESERDRLGRISLLKLPDRSVVRYTYDGPFVAKVSRVLEGEERYAHSFVKRDWMGHLLEERLPGALGNKSFLWNSAGQCLVIESDFLKDCASDGYDALGNLCFRKRVIGSLSQDYSYEYDGLSRLIRENGGSYEYDLLGNRLKKGTIAYEHDDSNRLLSAGDTTFTYHSNGCLASKKKGVDGWFWGADRVSFGTNGLGQVTKFEKDRYSESYQYDLSGRRLSRKGSKVQRYFYLGGMELGCLDEAGRITELKVPSDPNLPDSRAISIELNGEIYIPIYDLDGSIACLVDLESREIAESYTYTAFGEESIRDRSGSSITNSSLGNPWRYRGKRVDEESGLIWFGYRYYDPEIGRWLTPDPLGTVDSLNLYLYAHNNPIKYLDRMGLQVEIDPDCECVNHGHPGYYHRPPGCICICGRRDGELLPEDLISAEQFFADYNAVAGNELVFANSRIAPWLLSLDGVMQAAFGMIEASVGGALTLTPLAPLGWMLMAHGFDQSLAGARLLWAGEHRPTLTAQLLQRGGLSSYHANLVDSGISIFGTIGGAAGFCPCRIFTPSKLKLPPYQNSSLTLYRGVKPEELLDVKKTGIFRNLGSAEGKYFTTSPEGASSYAKQAVKGFGDPPYTLVKTQVNREIFNGLSPAFVDGGIPAWVIPNERLETLVPEIVHWMPIPK